MNSQLLQQPEVYYIYNMQQGDFYLKNGLMPIGSGTGKKGDAYLLFSNTNKLQNIFRRWSEICKNGFETYKATDD